MKPSRILLPLLITAVAASVAASFVILGSPGQERSRRMDEQRVQDLVAIAYAIDGYWNEMGELPASLDLLEQSRIYAPQSVRDPETGEAYAYEPEDAGHFTLCATFNAPSDVRVPESFPKLDNADNRQFWNHPGGYHCFQITVQDRNMPAPLPVRPMN